MQGDEIWHARCNDLKQDKMHVSASSCGGVAVDSMRLVPCTAANEECRDDVGRRGRDVDAQVHAELRQAPHLYVLVARARARLPQAPHRAASTAARTQAPAYTTCENSQKSHLDAQDGHAETEYVTLRALLVIRCSHLACFSRSTRRRKSTAREKSAHGQRGAHRDGPLPCRPCPGA